MTCLTLNSQLRTETDAGTISTLVRKGWVETVPPSYDTTTQHAPEWINGTWVVRDKTAEEIAADSAKTWPTKTEFWAEFTDAEKLAILDSTIPQIRLLDKELTMWSGSIASTDARIIGGMSALVTAGILTEARSTAILSKS